MRYWRKLEYIHQEDIKAQARSSHLHAENRSEAARELVRELGEEVEEGFPFFEAVWIDRDYERARELLDQYELE